MTRARRAPELSAILTCDSCCTMAISPSRLSRPPANVSVSTRAEFPRCAPCRPSWRRADRAQLYRIRERLRRPAEFEAELLLGQHRQLLRQLVRLELPQPLRPVFPFRRHLTAPPASRTST